MRREYVKIKQSVYDELIEIKAKYILMLKVFEMLNINTEEDKEEENGKYRNRNQDTRRSKTGI